MITIKSPDEIERMRRAGRIVAEVLALVENALRPGIMTADLEAIAARHIRQCGAKPSVLNYLGNRRYGSGPHAYPATTCISIDEQVVHGIPGRRVIHEGEIVSVDVAAIWQGWHADTARSWVAGGAEANPEAGRLVETTRLALMAGIGAARPGRHVEDISAAVEDAGREAGYDLLVGFVGHGIGRDMHEDPDVPNIRTGSPGPRLEPGMCFAIEPMLTAGSADVRVAADGWTVVTKDRSLAAHFEHSIVITPEGAEILTRL